MWRILPDPDEWEYHIGLTASSGSGDMVSDVSGGFGAHSRIDHVTPEAGPSLTANRQRPKGSHQGCVHLIVAGAALGVLAPQTVSHLGILFLNPNCRHDVTPAC